MPIWRQFYTWVMQRGYLYYQQAPGIWLLMLMLHPENLVGWEDVQYRLENERNQIYEYTHKYNVQRVVAEHNSIK